MIPRDHVSTEARVIVVITPKGQFLKANRKIQGKYTVHVFSMRG